MQQPSPRLTDPRFVYRSAAHTDVTITWRKFGWTPPSVKPAPSTTGFEITEDGTRIVFHTNGIERFSA